MATLIADRPTRGAVCTVQTPRGMVYLYTQVSSEFITNLAVDPGIGAFSHYKDAARQKIILCQILGHGGQITAAVHQGTLVGYLALCPPGPGERWADVPGIYETSLEVSRAWRCLGLARWLMRFTFADPAWERCIVVAQGYSWHWDLEEAGLNLFSYRDMFRRLHEAHGFAVFGTDEPEIACREGNILMGRVGEDTTPALRRAFFDDLYRGSRRPAWLEALLAAA